MENERIIERKTPHPSEYDRYVWIDGALTLLEDRAEAQQLEETNQLVGEWILYKWMYQLTAP